MRKISIGLLGLTLIFSLSLPVYGATGATVINAGAESNSSSSISYILKEIKSYTDIDESHIAYEAFSYLIDKGVVKGTTVTNLSPEDFMTRASFVTMLCRNFGGDSTHISESPYFIDVEPMSYYAPSVEWARTEKVTNGVSETLFGVDLRITKEQLVTMLYNYIQNHEVTLKSVEITDSRVEDMNDVSDWAFNAVTWGNLNGLLVKDEVNNFNPTSEATRSEMAIMLYNLDKLIQK